MSRKSIVKSRNESKTVQSWKLILRTNLRKQGLSMNKLKINYKKYENYSSRKNRLPLIELITLKTKRVLRKA